MNTPQPVPTASRRRRLTLASSVAALALMAFAGFEAGVAIPAMPAFAESAPPATAQAPLQGSAIRAPAALAPVSFADLVQKVTPAVISVKVKMVEPRAHQMAFGGNGDSELPFPNLPPDHPLNRMFGPNGQGGSEHHSQKRFGEALGSGFFISADGYAVTNNHVVENGKTVSVTTDDGKTYSAKVVGTDPKTDLALLKVDGRSDFPYVKLATDTPRVGDWVLAVGNPFGLGGTVTAGIVSARGRDIGAGPYDDFLQIDAPVNKGNSGGPTFDLSGNVVGVNTAIYSPSGGSVGIAFDIPSQTVQSVVTQLREHGSVTRGYIGVQIQPITRDIADGLGLKEAKGALVAAVTADSPASKAGLKSGDAILQVNGKDVADARELSRDIAGIKPGDKAGLTIWRDGDKKTVELSIARYPGDKTASASNDDDDATGGAKLGLSLAPASEVGKGNKGVAIVSVDPDSAAAERGLRSGDLITGASGKTVSSPDDVRKAIVEAKRDGRKAVLLQVERDGNSHFVAVPFVG